MMSSDAVFTCTRLRVTMPAIQIAGQQLLGSNANVHHEVLDRRQSSFHAPASPPSPPVHVAPPVTSCAGIFVSSTFQLANCFGGRPPPLLTQKELSTKCRPDIRERRPSATSHSWLPSVIDSRIFSWWALRGKMSNVHPLGLGLLHQQPKLKEARFSSSHCMNDRSQSRCCTGTISSLSRSCYGQKGNAPSPALFSALCVSPIQPFKHLISKGGQRSI
jgi:hypothetical protein